MEQTSLKKRIIRGSVNNKAVLLTLFLCLVLALSTQGKFLTATNLLNVVRQNCIMAVMAIGFTAVLASGFFNLSIGYMLGTVGVIGAILMKMEGLPFPFALLLTLVIGGAFGFINSLLIRRFDLPPFIVTLSTGQIFRGMTYLLSDGTPISGLPSQLITIGQGYFLGIPIPIYMMLAVGIILSVIMGWTSVGRHIIAVGGNREASRVSGINVVKVQHVVYTIMGICVSIAAILMNGRTASAQPTAGVGMEMDAIAAVVIGGTPLSGGYGNVFGSVFGCLIVGLINNGLNLLNVNSYWQWIVKGVVILLAMILDGQTTRLLNKLGKK